MKITSDSQSGWQTVPGDRVVRKKREGICKNTWYFEFNLQAPANLWSAAGVASQLESLSNSQCRLQSLKTASIISFSSSDHAADGSSEIRGFISGGSMWQQTVRTWLTNSAVSNLQLHPIADRFRDQKILSFLADSTLPLGLRLRVDTMGPSDAPRGPCGRPCRTGGDRASAGAGAAAGSDGGGG